MSYVDAIFDRDADTIKVVERVEGARKFQEFPVKYTFYHEDPRGKHKSIFGDPLQRIVCKNTKEFRKEVAINKGKKMFESDVNPIFQCLSENFLNQDAPKLNIAFFDIETDFDPDRGFADPSDPFMGITSISIYLQWLETMICLAVPPKTLTMDEAQELIKDIPGVVLFEKEADMLDTFLDVIEDSDILSGWNSEGYDIPYTVNRVARVLSKNDTRRFCLWDQLPKRREFERFGKTAETFDLVGRVHLDSLQLYRKFTYEERHSYRLDAIGEIEVNERKTQYEGTLDQLYNNDFKLFIEYNIQDTALLDKLDKKLKFIDLSNELAHSNTVLLQTTMGAVALTEQAIINEAHHRGLQVPNRSKYDENATQAAGAYVAFPKKGLHKWIGSMDLNSLYPSVIRSLNMGPETIIGQLRPDATDAMIHEEMTLKKKSFAGAWEGHFGSLEYEAVIAKRKDFAINVDWEDGRSDVLSGAEIYQLIFDSQMPWTLSANGTIFTTEFEGVIPGILKRWYAERKELQAMKKKAEEAGNATEKAFWDKRQLVKKINLNSLYGAILNPGCRFFDKRIGQSTTLTGRQIVKHMSAEVNKVITGEYDHTGKAVIYGDTDSCEGTSLIETSLGTLTIEELFDMCENKTNNRDKEYAIDENIMVMSYDIAKNEPYMGHINYVYRHKVEKDMYEIEDSNGNIVTVTEDHSVMVEREGKLLEVKPVDINIDDIILSLCIMKKEFTNILNATSIEQVKEYTDAFLKLVGSKKVSVTRGKVSKVTKIKKANDYVYDIGMKNSKHPWFFANNILIHNSVYFSAYPILAEDIANGNIPWDKDSVTSLYDQIADQVDTTFSAFAARAFHCPKSRATVIKAGREIVASSGLYITKKRYAALVYDDEGERKDTNGSPGKVKAMGLDLRRSDTPVYMQDFLKEILLMVLQEAPKEDVLERITKFRKEFEGMPGWEKGSPKRANKVGYYRKLEEKQGKANMPGHVRAALNWNTLKRMNGDKYSQEIVDGMKCIVCKLKQNPLGYTSVAYPTDELRLPEWFKELPFDGPAMADTIIDNKLKNLIGVLDFDLEDTKQHTTFSSLFDFGD